MMVSRCGDSSIAIAKRLTRKTNATAAVTHYGRASRGDKSWLVSTNFESRFANWWRNDSFCASRKHRFAVRKMQMRIECNIVISHYVKCVTKADSFRINDLRTSWRRAGDYGLRFTGLDNKFPDRETRFVSST